MGRPEEESRTSERYIPPFRRALLELGFRLLGFNESAEIKREIRKKERRFLSGCNQLTADILDKSSLTEEDREIFQKCFAVHLQKWLMDPPSSLIEEKDNLARDLGGELAELLFPVWPSSSSQKKPLDHAARQLSLIFVADLTERGLLNEFLRKTLSGIKSKKEQKPLDSRFGFSARVQPGIDRAFAIYQNEAEWTK